MKLLVVYDARHTYTNTVHDHLAAFGRYSASDVSYVDFGYLADVALPLESFDGVVQHYSVRLPHPSLSVEMQQRLSDYTGLKCLYIQDEYENVAQAVQSMNFIHYDLVFTCVPEEWVPVVYADLDRSSTEFHRVLTGYVPLGIPDPGDVLPPSKRELLVGYRGRTLGPQYGRLGQLKVEFPRVVRDFCRARGLAEDIRWDEKSRLYGPAWAHFLERCRGSLGTPSGSNVFDLDGSLLPKIERLRIAGRSDRQIYDTLVSPLETPGVMDQISPRVFEAVAHGSCLVLLEGNYSGVLEPGRDSIQVSADYSNIDEAIDALRDGPRADDLWKAAYGELIVSGNFSFKAMIKQFDDAVGRYSMGRAYSREMVAMDFAPDALSVVTLTPTQAADTPKASYVNRAKGAVRQLQAWLLFRQKRLAWEWRARRDPDADPLQW